MPKSFIAIETHICPICLTQHETGGLLLHKKLKNVLARQEITGASPCPTCQQHLNEGFVALVELGNEPSLDCRNVFDLDRTGNFAFLQKGIAAEVFPEVPQDKEVLFVMEGVFEVLRGMVH